MEKCGSLGELLCLGEQMKGGHSAKISPLKGELRDWSSMGEKSVRLACCSPQSRSHTPALTHPRLSAAEGNCC